MLNNKEHYLELLINAASHLYILLDRDANVLYYSNSILNMLGRNDFYEFIDNPLSRVHSFFEDPAFIKRSMSRFDRSKAGEELIIEDDTIYWPQIGNRSYRITYKRLNDEKGDFDGSIIVLHDITDVRLQEAERRINDILCSTQLPCVLWDENGHVLAYNSEIAHMLDLPNNLPSMEFHKLFLAHLPEYQPGGEHSETLRQRCINEALKKGFVRAQIQLLKKDGTPIHLGASLARVACLDSYRILTYYHDLTEVIRQAEEAKASEERMKLMLDGTPLICILRNDRLEVIDCNKEALNIFGFEQVSDFIREFNKFYPEFQPDGSKSVERLQQLFTLLDDETNSIKFEWTFHLKSGELLPVDVTLVRISWKDSHLYLSYSRDLRKFKNNERKMLESIELNRALELQKEKAQAASEAKTQFLSSMSHEIRTPMNTIMGLLELMRTDNLDVEQMKYITDMKYMSHVLLNIINDILDFNKIEAGKMEILPLHFNLYMFYSEMISQYQIMAETKGLQFKSSFAPDLPRSIFGDELRLHQIATNLITNAIKYTRKGYVNFDIDSVEEDGQKFLTITVSDSGIGIKEEHLHLMFQEFEQFDLQKNRGIIGTGLGLSIVKRLVTLMNGQIKVKSVYGQGSEFIILLPLEVGDSSKIDYAHKAERVIAQSITKVLVVDDNQGNLTVAVGMLARHGIIPHTADNGLQAIKMIKAHKYDMVFMDHMMPEMDGVEATAVIRNMGGEYYTNLPIIALSANAIAGAREMFLNSGMNDLVAKPIDSDHLNRVLLKWLPPSKIADATLATETLPSLEDEFAINKQLEELIKIEDLNVMKGLTRVGGNKKLYKELLWQFCNSADNNMNSLQKNAKNGHWKDYAITIHGLKTVFANIGNQSMSDWAASLEVATMTGDTLKCARETSFFCGVMREFYTQLKQTALIDEFASQGNLKKISTEELQSKLESLREACHGFNADVADAIAKELVGVTLTPTVDVLLNKLLNLVNSFDYDKAIVLIEKLTESLQMEPPQVS